ncbi:MAG: sugar transferase [Thermoanaerobaculia bacterium]|nr:MAG: sugar transferase [Thermoanaerobaculia bacterium]
MLKQRARLVAASVFVLDLALVAAAFLLAHAARSQGPRALGIRLDGPGLYPLDTYLPLLPLALAIWGLLLWTSGRYRSHRRVTLVEEASGVISVTATATALFALAVWGFRLDERLLGSDRISRGWIAIFALLAAALVLAEKVALRLTARRVRARGLNFRTVVVVGTSATAVAIAEAMREHRWWGYRVVGFVEVEDADAPVESARPRLGGIGDLPRVLAGQVVDEVVFAVPPRDLGRFEDQVLALQEQGILVRLAIDVLPHARTQVHLEEIEGVPLVTLATGPTSPLKLALKRLLDLVIASAMLLAGLPVLAAIALAIRFADGGAVLFRQPRCGRNGRIFTLYKFRTMVEGAEERLGEVAHLNEMNGPVFKMRSDPRVTRLGRLLRRFSLDELPQLWNVVRGDMSLVGPRPPIPEEVARYERWQRRRLAMKPGLTCLWQVRGRNAIDFEEWMRLDLEYIDNWSPWLDLKILARTVPVVLSGRGAS